MIPADPAPENSVRCDAYPGYEWVLTLSGTDWTAIHHVGRLFDGAGLDAYCPGTSAFAGFLARHEQAAEARRLLTADSFLRERCAYLEDSTGSHPLFPQPGNA